MPLQTDRRAAAAAARAEVGRPRRVQREGQQRRRAAEWQDEKGFSFLRLSGNDSTIGNLQRVVTGVTWQCVMKPHNAYGDRHSKGSSFKVYTNQYLEKAGLRVSVCHTVIKLDPSN